MPRLDFEVRAIGEVIIMTELYTRGRTPLNSISKVQRSPAAHPPTISAPQGEPMKIQKHQAHFRHLVLTPLAALLFAAGALVSTPISAARADEPLIAAAASNIAAPAPGQPAIFEATGSPGSLALWGEGLVPLVIGSGDGGVKVPVLAMGTLGKGRFVAAGHGGYTNLESVGPGAQALLTRAGTWLLADRPGTIAGVSAAAAPWAKALARDGKDLKREDLTAKGLEGVALLVLGTPDLSPAQGDALMEFIERGGGVVVAQTGWGWQQIKGGLPMTQNALNRAFARAGLSWTDAIADETAPNGYALDPAALSAAQRSGLMNASTALDALVKDTAPTSDKATKLDKRDRAQASAAVINAARTAQPTDTILLPRLATLLKERGTDIVPRQGKPVRGTDGLSRALLAYDLSRLENQKPEDVKAHPAATAFPGSVPESAPRISRSTPIALSTPGWHSLGLYAAPGEIITITRVGGEGQAPKGLAARIGSHTDTLWHKDTWDRVPDIAMRVPLAADGPTRLASPFGGLIYIDVPDGRSGEATFKIEGAVDTPLFVLGKTTPEAWAASRAAPGPWAELASGKIIVTVPSALVRDLSDPVAVMTFWNQVADAAADLAKWPRERERAERYVADIQISAGYMHSGYPIMTHLDAAPDMVSVENLRAGTWGLYHELGHNHQSGDWTFDGTGEVTVNLFSMYILETACEKPMGSGHGALAQRAKLIERHAAKGRSFDHWKSDPFLALVMYQQLREAFGWEAYKAVFETYRTLPNAERPRTEEQKRDQWMVRFSRQVGKNLGPFFEAWGVPTSQAARESIKELPAWMPADMGPLVTE
jgi:hypothetical protein